MNLAALQKINYGMFIVGSKYADKLNGQIANTVFQVSAEPPAIAVCINKQNLTHELISKSKIFSVSVLSQQAPMEFIGRFGFRSGKDFDKFEGINYKAGITGAPIVIENSTAYFEAEVTGTADAGTHTLFIGKITACEILSDSEPMTYSFYHLIKKGKSPKAAPTYVKEEIKTEAGIMKKYKCTVCGYIYDPEQGDPDGKIKPGTPFEQLPETWTCPVCGAPKSAFEPAE